MPLDFWKRALERARDAADGEDIDAAMAPEGAEALAPEDPVHCCPKCGHEFPESEEDAAAYGEGDDAAPPPPALSDDLGDSEPDGFTYGRR